MKPHPDEVDDYKYVTEAELVAMMADKDLLWSPWFRIIVDTLLVGGKGWWKDLDGALLTDKFVDKETIYTFGPPFKVPPPLPTASLSRASRQPVPYLPAR